MGGACSTHERDEKSVHNIYHKPERKRAVGKTRRKCKDNIIMDRWEIGWVLWAGLIWLEYGPVADFCERSSKPLAFIQDRKFLG